jgi:hypothetical protein
LFSFIQPCITPVTLLTWNKLEPDSQFRTFPNSSFHQFCSYFSWCSLLPYQQVVSYDSNFPSIWYSKLFFSILGCCMLLAVWKSFEVKLSIRNSVVNWCYLYIFLLIQLKVGTSRLHT